jgi:hypothetical protein
VSSVNNTLEAVFDGGNKIHPFTGLLNTLKLECCLNLIPINDWYPLIDSHTLIVKEIYLFANVNKLADCSECCAVSNTVYKTVVLPAHCLSISTGFINVRMRAQLFLIAKEFSLV